MRLATRLAALCALFVPALVHAQIDLDLQWTRLGDSEGVLGQERGIASVESAEFSPDGTLIVSGAKRGGDLVLWTAGGQEIWRRYHAGRAEIEVVAFTRDGTHIVSGGEDGFLRAWRVSDGAQVWNYSTNPNGGSEVSFDGLGLSNGGDRMAGGDEQGRLVVFDTSDPNPANWPDDPIAVVFQGPDNNATSDADINSVDWTQDDRFIVTAGRDATVKRWEVADLNDADQGLRQTYTGFQSSIKSVRLSPDDQLIAAGGQRSPDGLVLVWDYSTGNVVRRIDFPMTKKIEAVEWTPNGRFLITGGNEGRSEDAGLDPDYPDNNGFGPIRAFDRDNGFALALEQVTYRQEYFHFDASGSRLISSSEDGGLRLWDVTYGGATAQAPFGGTPTALPGRLEAERFDEGGPGVAYQDGDGGNQGGSSFRAGEAVDVFDSGNTSGGRAVGWIDDGEFLEFTVSVAQAGTYAVSARVATPQSGRDFRVEAGGASAAVAVPNTGGWTAWQTVQGGEIALAAGRQVVRLALTDGPFNLDWVSFELDQAAAFPQPGVFYTLRNVGTGGYLDTQGAGTVEVVAESPSADQRWRFVDAGNGAFWIVNARGQRGALDTRGGGEVRWTGQATPDGADKRWTVATAGGGSFRFLNGQPGRGALAAGAGGAAVWTNGTGSATRWVPTPVPSATAALAAPVAALTTGLPAEVTLAAPYPNPSQGQAEVAFGLPEAGVALVEVYDALGRRVAVVADGAQEAGWHRAEVGRSLAAGTYLVRLQTESGAGVEVRTQTFVVVR